MSRVIRGSTVNDELEHVVLIYTYIHIIKNDHNQNRIRIQPVLLAKFTGACPCKFNQQDGGTYNVHIECHFTDSIR